jgi:hypothetical protein
MARVIVSERTIRRNALARCPFSAAIDRAEAFIRLPGARRGLAHLLVATWSALVVEDFTDSVRRHDALEFRWHHRSKLLPSGRALLTVRPHAPHGAELQFTIAYVPPFGVTGRALDLLIWRYVASITSGVLLRHLREGVERREAAGWAP